MARGPRVLRPDRAQLYWDMIDLESQIEADHLARVVWAFVDGLDLSALYERIKARDEVAGRPTADPKVLLALWLYATLDGVGSARALARLCRAHAAYRWLCGGVPVNYHGLSDFRTLDGELLDRLLSESVAGLAAEGLVRPGASSPNCRRRRRSGPRRTRSRRARRAIRRSPPPTPRPVA